MKLEICPREEVLIYGVHEDFVYKHQMMFDYSLEELYQIVKENNGTLIQAHPFRSQVLDVNFLDGLEINCHPKYGSSHSTEVIEIAQSANLIVTCGGDYHGDVSYYPVSGTFLPAHITDSYALGNYIRSTDAIKLCVHEPNHENTVIVNYSRDI